MAEFKLSRLKYTWLGAWTQYARYNPDDIISFAGQSYVCLESHVAGVEFYGDLNHYNNDTPPLLVPKWELMADGKSWLGDWAQNTYYSIGDIIKRGGALYICTFGHTSPASTLQVPNAETLFTVNGRDSQNNEVQLWAQYFSSQSWMRDWGINTYYKINDVVRYGGRLFKCIAAHTSANDIKGGLDASAANWTTISIVDSWTGDWQIDTKYKLNDLVKDGGNVYQCIVAHVSAQTELAGRLADDSSWALIHDGVQYTGEWTSGLTTYKVNDIVKYGSYLYICTEFHTAGTSFNLDYWSVYCPGVQFDQEWQGTVIVNSQIVVQPTAYQIGDIVRYGGTVYVATTASINQNPSTSFAWEKLLDGSKVQGDWDQYHPYSPGDVVRRGGNLYAAIVDNLNQDPDFFNDDTTTNSVYWNLIISGSKWSGAWTEGRTYVVGETVIWVSSAYVCQDKHFSDNGNRPDDDYYEDGSTIIGRYWLKVTKGNNVNRLKKFGDIRTFAPTQDGSTVGYTTVEIGTKGFAAQTENGLVNWRPMFETPKVYYVALTGVDNPESGTSPNSPWRTLRYALDNITGYATVNVRTGVYEEILPLRVPAFVAVQGDELRSTIIKPGNGIIDQTYYDQIIAASQYVGTITEFIVQNIAIGADDPDAPTTLLYGEIPQDFSAGAATFNEALIINSLTTQLVGRLTNFNPLSISGSNELTPLADRLKAYNSIINNKEFIKNEATLYIQNVFNDSTAPALPARWEGDIDRIVSAMIYDTGYVGNYKISETSTYFINAFDYNSNKISNMFLMRDGTGLRNCTLVGLDGVLGDLNIYLTRRPTAGAYASLDPGWGPSDSSAWVGTKSPYIQNVTTFGTGCIGLKIDGDLHGGGNQTIVSNDFTQILSDGIGVWANGAGRTEAVSVFTYYNHIGYLCTAGGKIRGTNGNCSYGTYGAVSEGFSTSETPITATVNNRYYQADIAQTLIGPDGNILKVFYSDAGVNYTSATYNLEGAGNDAVIVGDDFRDGAVHEVRIITAMDSTIPGGSSYLFNTNTSQGGDDYSIILAGSNENTADEYRTLRLLLTSGTGTGQYGYIAEYDDVGKVAYIAKESTTPLFVTASTTGLGGSLYTLTTIAGLAIGDRVMFTGDKFGNIQDFTVYFIKTINTGTQQVTLSLTLGGATYGSSLGTGSMTMHFIGWEHIVPGTPILSALDQSSNYSIEPRVTFSSPGFSATAGGTMPSESQWFSVTSNDTVYVAVGLALNTAAYSTNAQTWLTTNLPFTGLWSKVKYVNGQFFAFAEAGKAARSADGITWSAITTLSTSVDWRDVTYGNGKYVAVANGGTSAATSTDGITWTAQTLPEGADWNSIEYGKGRFVVAAQGDSSLTNLAYSSTGLTGSWTISSLPSGINALAYGNNKFVAISGGYIGANSAYHSVDGITWSDAVVIPTANWQDITYGQGLFMAVASGTSSVITSQDGTKWTTQSIPSSATWSAVRFANIDKPGKFIIVAGGTGNSTATMLVTTGVTAQARAFLTGGKVSQIRLWDTGSGYVNTPAITITDPNNVGNVLLEVRKGNGVLGVPTIDNGGTGYAQTSTIITITGNGYKDQYQIGSYLVVDGLTRIPGPGDNVNIGGINDYTYKLLNAQILSGTVGNYTARLNIGKSLNIEESPEHSTPVTIRQLYSQCRLTGHDFLDIGLGNFIQTNYPDTLFPNGTVLQPETEVQEANGGRVFYTTTDQDGNFRVGELFAVEQSTGIVTLNAQFFQLQGLEELRLGGIIVGGTGVVVREFSTDVTFTADSNNIIPTQKAIKAYIQRRVSGGGADAITGGITAGVVRVGLPDIITTTDGSAVNFTNKVNFTSGIDGNMLVLAYFTSAGSI